MAALKSKRPRPLETEAARFAQEARGLARPGGDILAPGAELDAVLPVPTHY